MLRNPNQDLPFDSQKLSSLNPYVIALLGSEYSISVLKESVDTILPRIVATVLKDTGFNWSSEPEDLAAKLGIDDAFRQKVAEGILPYTPSFKSSTFFCSQLVGILLQHAGLIPQGSFKDAITPTGLYATLKNAEWRNVTESDYLCDVPDTSNESIAKASCVAAYLETMGAVHLNKNQAAVVEATKILEAAFKGMKDILDGADRLLDRLRGKKID